MLNNTNIELTAVFAVSTLISLIIIIWFKRIAFKSTKRNDIKSVQASHITPVARIGGLSVMIAMILANVLFFESTHSWSNYSLLLLSAFPVFLAGLCEDLGFFSRPRVRFLAAIFSGVLFIALFELWLPRTDIPGLDFVLKLAPVGIGFSLFFAAGISHSFNLIDGLNGLSGFISVGVSLSLAMISHQMGLDEYRDVLLILSSAIAGFLVLNFPFGKIFLGDGGAYVIGHILVWMAISILCAAPNITPLAMLLIFFFPVADTLLAIMRRVYLGAPISHPDRLHFHQLIMRAIEIMILGRKRRRISNPVATAIVLPFAFIPMAIGILLVLDRDKATIFLFLTTMIFLLTYKICMQLTRRFRRSI